MLHMNNKYQGRKYSVQAYDLNWPKQYQTEVSAIAKLLDDNVLSYEHIGSTSVPELAGKPTIDVLAIVRDIELVVEYEVTLKTVGYSYLGAYVKEDSRLFVKEEHDERLVNLHFFPENHSHVPSMLKLRNYLRNHLDVVREYSDLKFSLLEQYPDDYGMYRKYKDEWMNNLKREIGIDT